DDRTRQDPTVLRPGIRRQELRLRLEGGLSYGQRRLCARAQRHRAGDAGGTQAPARRWLVSRFRSSHHCAAASFANSESKDTTNLLISCGFGSEVRISDSLQE